MNPNTMAALYTAHVACSLDFEPIAKEMQGYGYKYADLAYVRGKTTPVLAAHGLTIIQEVVGDDPESVSVTTVLAHVSGAARESTATMKVSEHKGMGDEQQAGTAITYLRRYAWLAVCGLAPEDSDAAPPLKTTAPRVARVVKPPRPAGDPPTIEGKPLTSMPAELMAQAAKHHPNNDVKKWAAFLVAGGQA